MSDEEYNYEEDYEYEYTDDEDNVDDDPMMEDPPASKDPLDGNPNGGNGDRGAPGDKKMGEFRSSGVDGTTTGGNKRRSTSNVAGRVGDNPNAPPMMGKFGVVDGEWSVLIGVILISSIFNLQKIRG